ncbi:MAG TPA: aminotransferase class IV [Alphaproteobacteria bacterium]|nr:aminotransferase class IV [Alphaproteobacteria bacterium]
MFPLRNGVLVFLNGAFVPEEKAVVSVFDRGFLYGDGLFEAIRIFNGKPFRWQEHIERLRAGADFLKIKLPYSAGQLRAAADKLIARNKMPDSLLRIVVSRGIGAPGYSPKTAVKPTLVMSLRSAPKLDPNNPPQWKLITAIFRVPANDLLGNFKTSNKLLQVLARAGADEVGADEALLLDTDGFVTEGTSSNIFWVKRGALYTPPISAGILPGVTRAVVSEIAADIGVSIREENIRIKDLGQADGIFLSLTSLGVVEVISLDGKVVKRAMLTERVRKGYGEMTNNA